MALDLDMTPLEYELVRLGDWVLVVYEEEKSLGRVIAKVQNQFKVQCLQKPFGICLAQQFEKEIDTIFYKEVYKAPVIPWATELDDNGNRTRKTFFKYCL